MFFVWSMTAVGIPALIRLIMLIIDRKSRAVPYCVRSEISDNENPYTIYYEKIRSVEGILLCAAGLYMIAQVYAEPVHTFSGSFVLYLIIGFILLALGLPLCFICSAGCVAITQKRVIIFRTRCFFPRTLTIIPREKIQRACRISAGRKGVAAAFVSMIIAFIKGDGEKAADMRDAAFMSGYLEVRSCDENYVIRLGASQADDALNDIAQLCEKEIIGGKKEEKTYSRITPIICAAAALITVTVMGIALTAEAKNKVEQQYVSAVYLEDTQAFSQAYVEFEHLAEQYGYKDSAFRADYCYARLEITQGNYARAVERINSLEDFEDRNELLYHCAVELSEGNSAALAAELFDQLGSFEDSEALRARIDEVYNMSVKAYEEGDLLTAAEGFSILRDYKDTTDYVSLIAGEADRIVPNRGNPENLDGDEILRRCNEAMPILEELLWYSECASLKALCEEFISIYTFD